MNSKKKSRTEVTLILNDQEIADLLESIDWLENDHVFADKDYKGVQEMLRSIRAYYDWRRHKIRKTH